MNNCNNSLIYDTIFVEFNGNFRFGHERLYTPEKATNQMALLLMHQSSVKVRAVQTYAGPRDKNYGGPPYSIMYILYKNVKCQINNVYLKLRLKKIT